MIRHLAAAVGALAITLGTVGGLITLATDAAHGQPRDHYVACASDASPLRDCVWDARHRGNGMGQSFYAGTGGRIYPLPHHIAHYLLGLPTPPA
jgi:hypothetical protein